MKINDTDIVSSTELIRNFKQYRKMAKKTPIFIFRNNYPDLVLIDCHTYNKILYLLDKLDDADIEQTIINRDEKDNGKRYTLEEIKNIRKNNKIGEK